MSSPTSQAGPIPRIAPIDLIRGGVMILIKDRRKDWWLGYL